MKQHWERNSNCRTDLFNKQLSYTTASKKDDFELSKLKEPLDSLTNNPSVKNITRLPVWNNHYKDKCFSCPVDFISISFTSFEGKKRSSKLVYSPTVHCTNHLGHYWIQSTKYQLKSALTWSTCPVRWLSGDTPLFCHLTPSSAPLILSPPSSALKLLSALITVSRREDCLDRSEAGGAASAQLTPDKPQPPPACGRGLCDPQLNKRPTTFFFFYI